MPSPPEIRAHAASLLNRIIVRKQTTDQVLQIPDPDPLLIELTYGTLRHYFSLVAAVDRALRQPLRAKDHDLRCLMLVGLYQLNHTRIPRHAAINETVEAARVLGKPWATALVNAVLRNAPTPERSFEHPRWMERELQAAYADQAPAIMVANNERAPMALRVNLRRIAPTAYYGLLSAAGLEYRTRIAAEGTPPGWGGETIILEQPLPARRLPGYAEGLVSIQDAGAQLVAAALTPTVQQPSGSADPGARARRMLDACAAPGGKLFHLLERYPELDAVALDVSPSRLESLAAEARRLGHRGYAALAGDATALEWWDREPFDLVLLDAPCSGSGTLRRHPDIKVLRQRADLPRYAALQLDLLRSLWRTVKAGGTLLYCTCSLFPAENDDVIDQFLKTHPDAAAEPISLPTGQRTRVGWQLLPIDSDTDGFYFARIGKSSS